MGICRACKSRVQMDVVVVHAGGSDTASRGIHAGPVCVCILFTASVRALARQVLTKYTDLTRKASYVYACRSVKSAKVRSTYMHLQWTAAGAGSGARQNRAAAKQQRPPTQQGIGTTKRGCAEGASATDASPRRLRRRQVAKLPSHGALSCWRLGAWRVVWSRTPADRRRVRRSGAATSWLRADKRNPQVQVADAKGGERGSCGQEVMA